MIRPKLTICMISRELMHVHTTMSLIKASSDAQLLSKYDISQKMFIGCSSLHITRSIALTEWFQSTTTNGDLFMFIDADQTFTAKDILKAIDILYETESDIVCGAYIRHDGDLTVKPFDKNDFTLNCQGSLKFGATGFMLISKKILDKMDLMPVHVDARLQNVIPYFQPRIVQEVENTKSINLWLTEDYSFCWLVRHHKGKIYGFISPTIGHILSKQMYIEQ